MPDAPQASAPAMPRFGPALMRLWPHGDSKITGLRAAMIAQAPVLFPMFGLDTGVAIANFMGEITEECGGGIEVEENLNYRAPVLHSQWPQHFTMDQALAMQHNPVAIANQAYNSRMGNHAGSNDGWNFRGRGGAQTTGRDAYGKLGELMKLDLISRPELVNDTRYFLECALMDFVRICGCLPYAQRDDEVNETRHLNGGLIGLKQRESSIKFWERELGVA
jgi:putative chitinase